MSNTKVNLTVVISSSLYWGKGEDLADALANCNVSLSDGDQKIRVIVFTGVDEEQKDHFFVDGMGGLNYLDTVPRADIFHGKLSDLLPLHDHVIMGKASEVAYINKRQRLSEECESLQYELEDKYFEEEDV